MKTALEMTPVSSLSLEAVGYDDQTGLLAVKLLDGPLYHFRSVSPEVHKAMMEAKSIGLHYRLFVKPQYYGEKQEG